MPFEVHNCYQPRIHPFLHDPCPTQKAESAYPQVRALMAEWNRRLLEDFTEEERNSLMSMLERAMGKAIQIIEEEDCGKGGS